MVGRRGSAGSAYRALLCPLARSRRKARVGWNWITTGCNWVSSAAIQLGTKDDEGYVKGPTVVGAGDPEEEKAPLSEIINRLNEQLGADFGEGERLFLRQVQEDAIDQDKIRETALANTFEKFSLGIRPQLTRDMIKRMADNDALVKRCLNEPDFQRIVFDGLLEGIFQAITTPQSLPIDQDSQRDNSPPAVLEDSGV